MAKFNIEVELDWLEDEGYSIDEEIREEVVRNVKEELLKRTVKDIEKRLDLAIVDKLQSEADKIEQAIDKFVESVCNNKITDIKIPKKSSSWSSDVEYIPITEFIGQRFEYVVNEKRYDANYMLTDYSRDRRYSIAEKSIYEYLNNVLSKKVELIVKNAQKNAEDTVISTLENKLKEELALDTIKRLNIPRLLEELHTNALAYEKEGEKK